NYFSTIDSINGQLNEKYYRDKWDIEKNFEKRMSFITSLLQEYGSIDTESMTEIRYENRLLEVYDQEGSKFCRELERVSCEIDEGCLGGECIKATGGLEECHNGEDDDNDGITDCADPDCAAECGWICRDICEEGCWECNNRECSGECQECHDCDWNTNQQGCEKLCQDSCWKCEEEKCKSQPVCENCNDCEKKSREQADEQRCDRICNQDENSQKCEDCRNNQRYNQCREVCDEGCYQCTKEHCHEEKFCQECFDCHEGGGECRDECSQCWDCEREQCKNTPICSECSACEQTINEEIQAEQCDDSCDSCSDCESSRGESACKETEDCRKCTDCEQAEKRSLCDDVCQDECYPCVNEQCESSCEECWGCNNEGDPGKCESRCESCWDCEQNECKSQDFCASCIECEKRIYQEEPKCDLPCDLCDTCTRGGDVGEEYCAKSCSECLNCETPEDIKDCTQVCDNIIDEEDVSELARCYGMCEEKVIFYCSGMPQDTPCLQRYYECPGGTRRIPCQYFICNYPDGEVVKQTAFCGQEEICGDHRVWKDRTCTCEPGWYNCDEDAANGCESRDQCEGATEICTDHIDNDFDDLIDCQDLSSCEEKLCTLISEKICLEGECVIDCGENFVLNDDDECVPVAVCMVGYEYDEEGNCIKPPSPEVNETVNITHEINITTNISTNVTTNLTINVTLTNETNISVGITPDINVTPELNVTLGNLTHPLNETIPDTNETEPVNESCTEGEVKTTLCNNGEELTTATCQEGIWAYHEITCPDDVLECTKCGEGCIPLGAPIVIECALPTEEFECEAIDGACQIVKQEHPITCVPCGDSCLPSDKVSAVLCSEPTTKFDCERENGNCIATNIIEDVECPDGYYFEKDKCVFIKDEDDVCMPWQVLSEKGVCEDLEQEPNPEEPLPETEETEDPDLIEIDKYCAFREDCEDENAICSKGKCKILSDEVIEEEEIILTETVESENVPDLPVEELVEEEELIEEEQEIDIVVETVGIAADVPNSEKEQDTQKQDQKESTESGQDEKEGVESKEGAPKDDKSPDVEEGEEDVPFNPERNVIIDSFKGLFSFTGQAVKEGEAECAEDKDCGENRGCDPFRKSCYCMDGHFDCNGKGDGGDGDGCESDDATCGGRFEACRHGCSINQECIEELGRCECSQGYYECDGDWENGCESTEECSGCSSDDECAQNRCSEHDNSLIQFACVEDQYHKQESAIFSFTGGCIKGTGKTDTYLHFDFWGKDLEELNDLRFGQDDRGDWCERDSEGLIKQREELQSSMNQEFFSWFFEEYVAKSPEDWEIQMSGLYGTYWKFVNNAERMFEISECADFNVDLIDVAYKSEYGEVHYWEEMTQHEGREILTPYMQTWIFPPKEIMKEEFRKAMAEGRMPGPEGDSGPSPKEIEEMRKQEELMDRINDLSDKYGGSADFLIEADDDGDVFYRMVMIVNPDDVIKMQVINDQNPYAGEPDVTVKIDFDFLYGMIKDGEEDAQIESPPWARQPRSAVKDVVNNGKAFAKVSGAIVSGNIKVSPIKEVPTVLSFLKMMAGGKD
ncbi:MAG: hypothetical protein ABIH34_07795, partial [Nanoarchaeota archaeon]